VVQTLAAAGLRSPRTAAAVTLPVDDGAVKAPRVVGWGFLGVAFISRKMAWAVNQSGAEVRYVGSRDPRKASLFCSEWAGPWCTGSTYDEVLQQTGVDVVYIPVPSGLRWDWAERACRAGKHVVAEKPWEVKGAQRAQRACEAAGVQLMDATYFVHGDRLRAMRGWVDQGRIGEVRRVTAAAGSSLLLAGWYPDNIRSQPALEPTGALGDLGWYCIRWVLWAARWEVPRAVRCWRTDGGSEPTPVDVQGMIEVAGIVGSFEASFTQAKRQTAEVVGTNGTLRVDDFIIPNLGETKWNIRSLETGSSKFDTALAVQAGSVTGPPEVVALVQRMNQAAVGVKAPDKFWPRLGLLTAAVVEACAESMAQDGSRVPVLDPDRAHQEL